MPNCNYPSLLSIFINLEKVKYDDSFFLPDMHAYLCGSIHNFGCFIPIVKNMSFSTLSL